MDLDKIPLHEQAGETRPSTSAKRVEKKKSLDDFRKINILMANLKFWNLEARTGVRKLPDPVQNQVNHLLCDKIETYFPSCYSTP